MRYWLIDQKERYENGERKMQSSFGRNINQSHDLEKQKRMKQKRHDRQIEINAVLKFIKKALPMAPLSNSHW
jgi:hypothetical protein